MYVDRHVQTYYKMYVHTHIYICLYLFIYIYFYLFSYLVIYGMRSLWSKSPPNRSKPRYRDSALTWLLKDLACA